MTTLFLLLHTLLWLCFWGFMFFEVRDNMAHGSTYAKELIPHSAGGWAAFSVATFETLAPLALLVF